MIKSCSVISSPAGAVAKYRDEYVCHVCLSVCPRGYLRNHTRDLYHFLCMLLVSVARSYILWYVADKPHRLSAGRDDGSAQRGRSVIYDCLVVASKQ